MRKLFSIPLAMRAFAAFVVAILALTPARVALADDALDKLYEAAKAEGKVTLLSAPSVTLRNELTAAFTARFPDIQVEYTGIAGNALTAKVMSEARAGIHSIDAIIGGTTAPLLSLKPAGLLRPIEPELVLADVRDGSKWIGGSLAWADDQKTSLGMTMVIVSGVLVNTELVKEGEITGDLDLLNPKWKGKIASANPAVPGSVGILFRYFYDAHGPDFIRKLKAQDVVVTSDLRQLTDWVAKGRYPIGLGSSGQLIGQFQKQGIKNLGVKSSAGWKDDLIETPGFGALSVPKTLAHPHAARLFVNWLLTKEGQTAVVRGLNYPSRRLDVSQDGVLDFMRPMKDHRYVNGWEEKFLRHPNQKKVSALLSELKFGQSK